MARTLVQRSYFALLIAAPALVANLAASSGAFAYTPKDPNVLRMVARGTAYLEKNSASKIGGRAITGLALVKAGKPWNHPTIVQVAESIQAKIQEAQGDPSKLVIDKKDNDIYSIGTSAIFLISYDPSTYRQQIEFLLDVLAHRQKEHGGWGYESRKTGDTSMTQYAVLTMWEAHQAGFMIPPRMLEDVATWLLRTQDPSGAFGYQGQVSPTFEPVAQSDKRHSMVAAGLGSVYICADLMGLGRRGRTKPDELSALQAVEPALQGDSAGDGDKGPKKIASSLDPSLFRRVQERGNRWMAANFAIEQSNGPYIHYYLYALERYCSFRELHEGKGDRKDGPKWYNAGVEYLSRNQEEDGSWRSATTKPVDTGFAILFLLRSTQKSIQRDRGFGPGTLVGGRGFPKDGEVVIRNGQVVAKPLAGPFEAMRTAMNNPAEADLAAAIDRMHHELGPKESLILVTEFAEKLRSLVSDPSPDNRAAAVKALGRSGNLDNAPILILALDDEDAGVVLESRDGLRRLARKIGGFGLSDEYTPAQHYQAVKKWRAWYQELQPDAEF